MTRVSYHWHSAGPGLWHLFVVTTTARWTRVAYALNDAESRQISNDIPADADRIVEWSLPPVAVHAWRAQRAYGWDGGQ